MITPFLMWKSLIRPSNIMVRETEKLAPLTTLSSTTSTDSSRLIADEGSPREHIRVLVVDDDQFDRLTVRRFLVQTGMCAHADECSSADEAMQRLGRETFDCVLLDYYIPGENGVELLKRIRDAAPNLPVVIFTGRGDEEIAVELMKSGAVDYLPKANLDAPRLASSLRHAIQVTSQANARRRAEEDLRRQELRFRTLANAIPQFAWLANADGVYWMNQRWYEYTGASAANVGAWNAQAYVHPDHVERVMSGLRQKIAAGEPWEDTFPLRGKDGTYRWFLSRALPLVEDGQIGGYLGTNTDVTDQKAAQAERERLFALEREARAEAERAVRARDEVLAFVAHDLRNPLMAIDASASTLIKHPEAENQRLNCLKLIERATVSMKRLIQDLLDVSQLEAATFTLKQSSINIREVLREIIEMFEPQAQSKNLTFKCTVADDVTHVHADRGRLMQVLNNLVGNAVKFTDGPGCIAIRAQRRDDHIQIAVEDTGRGIAPEDLPRVFDRFWTSGRSKQSGAGLGLAICKGIIEAHGGTIAVESTIGRGTTFHITIPATDVGSSQLQPV